ncbi:hypothetical protein IKQ26_07380, partial [bacterium]|nr:hypothetical protein [bacterium]
KFDLIFLCRSDLWLPPHLDYDFKELAKFIDKRFDTRCEKGIMDVRDYEPLVEAERKTRDEMIKFLTSPQSEER